MEKNPTPDYVFKAYVVNTAAYDAGEREDSGAWLYFPPQAGEVQSLFEKIGLPPDASPGQYFMDDYVSHVEGMKNVLPMYGDIQKLSEVAQAVSNLSPEDQHLLAAVQASPYRLTTAEQFREFPDNIDFFVLEPQVKQVEDLGWRYLEQRLDLELSPALRAAIDPAPFGRQAIEEERGCFTQYGYLSLSGDEWQREHTAEHGQREPEKKTSIRERLEQSKKECAGKDRAQPIKEQSAPEL